MKRRHTGKRTQANQANKTKYQGSLSGPLALNPLDDLLHGIRGQHRRLAGRILAILRRQLSELFVQLVVFGVGVFRV